MGLHIAYHGDSNVFAQSFQRIQRNRQSRIRVKMCRKAGKRADEVVVSIWIPLTIIVIVFLLIMFDKVLEEDMAAAEEDIDIVGVEKKEAAEEERRMKAAVAKVGHQDQDYP